MIEITTPRSLELFQSGRPWYSIQLTVTSLLVSLAVTISYSGDRTIQVVGEVGDCSGGSAVQLCSSGGKTVQAVGEVVVQVVGSFSW